MQTLSMGCTIYFSEQIPNAEPAPEGSPAYNPFDLFALLLQFTTGNIQQLLVVATPAGVTAAIATDPANIATELMVNENMIEPQLPPVPVIADLITTTQVLIGNLATITTLFDVSHDGLIFGIDVSGFISAVS
jgi:hypothetical protein